MPDTNDMDETTKMALIDMAKAFKAKADARALKKEGVVEEPSAVELPASPSPTSGIRRHPQRESTVWVDNHDGLVGTISADVRRIQQQLKELIWRATSYESLKLPMPHSTAKQILQKLETLKNEAKLVPPPEREGLLRNFEAAMHPPAVDCSAAGTEKQCSSNQQCTWRGSASGPGLMDQKMEVEEWTLEKIIEEFDLDNSLLLSHDAAEAAEPAKVHFGDIQEKHWVYLKRMGSEVEVKGTLLEKRIKDVEMRYGDSFQANSHDMKNEILVILNHLSLMADTKFDETLGITGRSLAPFIDPRTAPSTPICFRKSAWTFELRKRTSCFVRPSKPIPQAK